VGTWIFRRQGVLRPARRRLAGLRRSRKTDLALFKVYFSTFFKKSRCREGASQEDGYDPRQRWSGLRVPFFMKPLSLFVCFVVVHLLNAFLLLWTFKKRHALFVPYSNLLTVASGGNKCSLARVSSTRGTGTIKSIVKGSRFRPLWALSQVGERGLTWRGNAFVSAGSFLSSWYFETVRDILVKYRENISRYSRDKFGIATAADYSFFKIIRSDVYVLSE